MANTGLYLVDLIIGNVGAEGAPTVHFRGSVYAPTGVVNGSAEITQAIAPPQGDIHVPHVDGVIRHAGLGEDKLLVTLKGTYTVSALPPKIRTYLSYFEAVLVVDHDWNGTASITYEGKTIDNLPVRSQA